MSNAHAGVTSCSNGKRNTTTTVRASVNHNHRLRLRVAVTKDVMRIMMALIEVITTLGTRVSVAVC